MKLLVAMDHRFDRTPDGAVWSWFFGQDFWARYLEVFSEVDILARVRDVPAVPANAKRTDGERVRLLSVPYYHGPWQYLLRAHAVRRAVAAWVRQEDAILLRSGQIGNCLARVLRRDGHPYALEVIGDPYDTFAPGAVEHPLRRFLRWWYPRQLRRLCRGAAAVAYVTEFALQMRYPVRPGAYATHFSSINLADEVFRSAPRGIAAPVRQLLTVGTMDQPYKGHDVLLRAFAAAIGSGLDLRLTIVGDGRYRPALETLSRELGVADHVVFLGQLPAGLPVLQQMDQADLFLLPSRTEGLPRALIEAMARAMPCLATAVGGIPELLSAEDLAPPGDVAALARSLVDVSGDLTRLKRMSARNLERARDYRSNLLQERRVRFYRHLEAVTQGWQQMSAAGGKGTPCVN